MNSRQETAGERFAADLAARYSSGRATRSAAGSLSEPSPPVGNYFLYSRNPPLLPIDS